MKQSELKSAFESADRPDLALITNHGYAGVEIPLGGAPDTGGQNMYVNSLALSLEKIGYRVTVFARGGFSFFNSDRLRDEPEYMTPNVRYVYIPGGGSEFIPKEDIAIALDEELQWLDEFIRIEASQRGCEPWQVYRMVNSHYWDAAVLGVRLVERWRNDIAQQLIHRLLDGVIDGQRLEEIDKDRHWMALGEAPVYHLGSLLLECEGSPATPVVQRVNACASRWAAAKQKGANAQSMICDMVDETLSKVAKSMAPALHSLLASEALGLALLTIEPDQAQWLKDKLDDVDTHVWTPHSLAELKDENYRNRPVEVRRKLKFCERRDHERMVCDRTQLFAATSTEIAERLRTHYRVEAEQIFYFPPCIDSSVFRRYSQKERQETWKYLSDVSGVPVEKLEGGKMIFETSRMDHTKRKDLLLDAFSMICDEFDDVYLFIGGGPENEVFKDLKKQLEQTSNLKGKAFLTGFIPEQNIGPLFSMASIYVSASEMEGFGMSVSQAAAARTAIVCSDLIPFAVQYVPEDAVIVHAGDVEDFAGAMHRLLLDDDERDWRAAGLAEKVQVLDWVAQTRSFIEYLVQRSVDIPEGRPVQ